MTQLELANIALGHLGTISLADYDEVSPEGLHVRRHWDLCRDSLLRQRHWNFAIARATLLLVDQANLTGVASTQGSADITVASATGLAVGMSIKGDFVPHGTKITVIASLTITLDATASVTGTGQTATAYTAPAFDYAYAYQLPTDYLLATEWNGREAGTGDARYDIEGATLLCDDDASKLRYVARIEDPDLWDANFQEAFALKLAARIAPGITTSQGLAEKLDQRAEQYLMKAFGPDNKETKPRAVLAQTSSGWLDAREGLDPRFA